MEIVVNGRNSEISERFREHVEEKLLRIGKYDTRQKIHRVEVEVTHEKNPRQHDTAAKVEMTLRSRGPAVRAEAASTDQHSALDAAIDKLESRLRRAVDRNRIHHGQRGPTSLGAATAELPLEELGHREPPTTTPPINKAGPIDVEGDCPLVVREKTHEAHADDPRAGDVRDGARRSRLLSCSSRRTRCDPASSTCAGPTTTASSIWTSPRSHRS